MSRLTILSDVVLPQPDGPTRMQILPAGTVSDRSLTAPGWSLAWPPPSWSRRSYDLVTWSNSTTAAWRGSAGHRSRDPPGGTVRHDDTGWRRARIGLAAHGTGPVPAILRLTCGSPRSGCERLVVPLDPPFPAAWDPVPRRSFAATIVRVETDEGVVGIGSGDTMDGFDAFEHLFIGAGSAGDRPPRPGARDDRLPRRPVLAARGRRCGTSSARSRACRSRRCSAAPRTGSRPTPRAGCCCRPRRGPSRRSVCARRASRP